MRKIAVLIVVLLVGTGCIFPGAISCSRREWEDLKIFSSGDPLRNLDMAIEALENEEKVYGKESVKLCPFIENAGKEYRELQDFVNAEKCYERSLKLQMQKDMLTREIDKTRLSLANIYFYRGYYIKAEDMVLQVLENRLKILDKGDIEIAKTMRILAVLNRWQGRFDKAREFYEKVIPVFEKYGDPDLPYGLKDYAFLSMYEGDFLQAEVLFRHALSAMKEREKKEGEQFFDIAFFMTALANSIALQGRMEEAEGIYLDLQDMIRERYGKGNFHEKIFHLAIGRFYRNLGRFMEAEEHYRYVATIFFLIGIVPDMSIFLEEIADFFREQCNFDEAEIILLKTKEAVEVEYGKGHPAYASVLNRLGVLYREWGRMTGNKDKYEFSEQYLNESIQITSQSVSGLHPCRNCLFHELALLYHYQGKLEEAEVLYRRAVDNYVEGFGPGFVRLRSLLLDLAILCRDRKNFMEAEDLEKWADNVPDIANWVD